MGLAGIRVVAMLVAARLRARWRRWALVAVALGVGVFLPVLARAVTSVTADAALTRSVAELAPGDRLVMMATFLNGASNELPGSTEARISELFGRIGDVTPTPILLFHQITDSRGGSVQLGGVDRLTDSYDLVEGRFPTSCEPSRCEVVTDVDHRSADGFDPTLGLVVVGSVRQRNPLLFIGDFSVDPKAAVVLGDGVRAFGQLRSLANFGRSRGWIAPVDLARIRRDGIDRWVAAATNAANDAATLTGQMVLKAPDDVLRTEVGRARRSADRFRILGGAMAILVLGAAVVGGAALRRDHAAFVAALRRRGMARRALATVVAAESSVVAIAGVVLGLLVGGVVAGLLARRAGLAVSTAVGDAVAGQWWVTAGLGLASAAVLAATLTVAGDHARGTVRRALTTAIVVDLLMIALVVGRGGVQADTVDDGDPLVAVLPALVLVLAGLLTARIWSATTAGVAELIPRGALAARLGFGGAAGRPLRPVATAALLASAIGVGVFALSYRQTLARGALDQAAFAVPLDVRFATGSALERPLDVITPQAAAAMGGSTFPVLHVTASVKVGTSLGEPVQLLGVDPAMLAEVHRWSSTVGSSDPAEVARRLVPGDLGLPATLPTGRLLAIDVTGPLVDIPVTAVVRSWDGRVRSVPLRVEPAGGSATGPQRLVGDLPDLRSESGSPAELRLTSLVIARSTSDETHRQHNLGEGNKDREADAGTVALGAVSVDAGKLNRPWSGWGGLTEIGDGSAARFDYVLTASRIAATSASRSVGLSVESPVPVAVDSRTAKTAGGIGQTVTFQLDGQAILGRVSAVLPRFPTLDGRFAVVDRAALQQIADVLAPGTGQPDELWASITDPAAAATAFPTLASTQRSVIEQQLRTDPVAQGASGLLLAAAGLTVALALIVLVLLVTTERHDDAAHLLTWEADGVQPSVLRTSLWWRAVSAALPAVPIGTLSGIGLSRLTARLIAVTATATVPRPPLVAGTGTWLGVGAAVGSVILALAVALLTAGRLLREPLPPRALGTAQ